MDNVSPKLAATFGVGFLGFILAAYSYNKHHKPDYTEELINKTNNEEDSTDDSNLEKISKEVKSEILKKSSLAEFLKKEFDLFKNNIKEVKNNNTN
tara:strand:- start:36711 stop:36998 length:288 start_codon:yes stop_codon:yes gene_type:complete